MIHRLKLSRGFLFFLLFFPVSTVFSLEKADFEKGSALNESAIKKTKEGDLDGAEADLLQALVYSGENPKVQKNLGVVYYEKGIRFERAKDFTNAKLYINRALATDPSNERYRKALGAALFLEANERVKRGEESRALELFQEAASYDENNIMAWVRASHIAWRTQNLDLAEKFLEKARALDPNSSNVKILEERLKKSPVKASLETQSSEHFILTAEAAYMASHGSHQVLDDLEDAYNSVSFKLSFHPRTKIPVIFYPINEFRQHWRAPSRVSGFYDEKLHIPYASQSTSASGMKPIIMHELTHAFLHLMIDHAIPQWLNEGLAQWIEGKSIPLRTRDALVTYEISRRVPDIAHLDCAFKEKDNPYNNTEMTLAYMKSFSLVEYMIERWGLATSLEMIKDTGAEVSIDDLFKKHFGIDSKEFEKSWLMWLERKQ